MEKIVPEEKSETHSEPKSEGAAPSKPPREIGGVKGPEPTRYGDWEHKGCCTDF
jgi:hypothetical protein